MEKKMIHRSKRLIAMLMAVILVCPTWNIKASETSLSNQDIVVTDLNKLDAYDLYDSGNSTRFHAELPLYYYGASAETVYAGAKEGQSVPGVDAQNDLKTYVFTNTYNGAYLSYLKSLEKDGWKPYSNNIIDGTNLFATYVKENGNTVKSIYAYYIASKKTTYLVTSANCVFENTEADNQHETVCTPQFTQLVLKNITYGQGMSYVLRLGDGRFIIIDGGFNEDGHAAELYAVLKEQNVLNKITVAAWIITHQHMDHLGTAAQFLSSYGKQDVEIQEVIFNFSTYADTQKENVNTWSTTDTYAHSRVPRFIQNLKTYWPETKIVTCHTGQEYYFADAKIEILHTIEDYYPLGIHEVANADENDSSVVFSIEIAGQKILVTADSNLVESSDLVKMWGEYLKSDIMQLPHHGNTGGTVELYELVDAQVVMIPAMRPVMNPENVNSIWNVEATKWVLDNTGGNIEEVIVQGYAQRTIQLPYQPTAEFEYISNQEQNGYLFIEPGKKDVEIPEPYMDLAFDGEEIYNDGVGYNTLEMHGGEVGTHTVYYKDKAYNVLSYRAEQGTDDYIHITMEDVDTETELKQLLFSDGFTFEVFIALDTLPWAHAPFLSNFSSGGISLSSRMGSAITNFQVGYHDATQQYGNSYAYALPADDWNHVYGNMVAGTTVTHVVGTYDSHNHELRLYRDGHLASKSSFNQEFKPSFYDFNQLGIGKNIGGSDSLASQTGYTVLRSRVYNTCLTDEQIASEYWDCVSMLGDGVNDKVSMLESGGASEYYENIAPFRTDKVTVNIQDEEVTYYTKVPEAPIGYKDYLFAGWYKDVECKQALKDITVVEGAYYAKFVPNDILGIKAQINTTTKYDSDTSDLRFITSVDSLDYSVVGFDITMNGETKSLQSDTVARKLIARNTNVEDGEIINYTPDNVFHKMSKYFLACLIGDISQKDFGRGAIATPYWITYDGTKVKGVASTKSVNMGYVPFMESANVEEYCSINRKGITTEAGCIDGAYYYQAEYYQESSKAGVYIHKYNMATEEVTVSSLLSLDKVNDLTYNARTQRLILSYNNQSKISIMNPVNFAIEKTITLSVPISAIDYNALENKYVALSGDGQKLYMLDSEFRVTGKTYARTDTAIQYSHQGIATDDSYIYLSHADSKVIVVYDWDGKYVTKLQLTNQVMNSVDVAGITVYNNTMYITCNADAKTVVYKVTGFVEKVTASTKVTLTHNSSTKNYSSLEGAMLDAKAGDIITLMDDVEVTSTMDMLATDVTITNADGTDVVITKTTKGNMIDNRGNNLIIQAAEGTTLTIDGVCSNSGTITLGGNVRGITVKENKETALIQLAEDYCGSENTIIPTIAKEHQLISGYSDKAIILDVNGFVNAWTLDANGWLRTVAYAQVTSKNQSYDSLSEAVKQAEEDDVITLLADFVLGEEIEIEKNLTITADKAITITRAKDLTGAMLNIKKGTVTISGLSEGTLTIDGNAGKKAEKIRAIKVVSDAMLNLSNAKIQNFNSSKSGSAVYSKGDQVTLDNVVFADNKGTVAGAIHLYVRNSSEDCVLRATNCTFERNESTKGKADAAFIRAKGKVVEFENSIGGSMNLYYGSQVTLAGEVKDLTVVYNENVAGIKVGHTLTETSDITITPKKNASGAYTAGVQLVEAGSGVTADLFAKVTKRMNVTPEESRSAWGIDSEGKLQSATCVQLSSNGVEYNSLSAAIAAAQSTDTIKILRDFTMLETVTVENKNISLTSDKAVHIIKGAEITGDLFTVKTGSALAVNGAEGAKITLNGNATDEAIDVRAILVEADATLTMKYTTLQDFYSNRTSAGVAVFNNGTTTLENVELLNNKSTTTSAGGAIRNYGGKLSMVDSLIEGNETVGDGGALYTNNASVTLTGCDFVENAGNRGGAIYNNTNAISITNCSFRNNNANNGGAFGTKYVNLCDVEFIDNQSGDHCDIYLLSNTYVTLSGVVSGLTVNYTAEQVGIKLTNEFDTEQSDITLIPTCYQADIKLVDVSTAGSAILADAVQADVFSVDMRSSSKKCSVDSEGYLAMNCVAIGTDETHFVYYTSLARALEAAKDGDNIVLLDDFTMSSRIQTSKSVTITANKEITIKRGAGLTVGMIEFLNGTSSIIGQSASERIIFDGYSSSGIGGRALWVSAPATFRMEYVTVKNGNNNNNGGAGLYNCGNTTLSNVIFDNNKTNKNNPGGAIRHYSGSLTISDSIISNSYGNIGAGLYAANGTKTTLIRCTFAGNEAITYGGAIDYEGAELMGDGSLAFVVTDCTFKNNKATTGGALCLKHATIDGATFEGNTATSAGDDVYVGSNSYITILGKLQNMSIAYSSTASATKIGGAIDAQSDITMILPSYTLGLPVVEKADDSVTDSEFKAATSVIKTGNEAWLVGEDGCLVDRAIAELNGVRYKSFTDAMVQAQDGDTIYLLDSFTIDSSVQITKSVTLVANKELTITRGSELTGAMFEFASGTISIVGASDKQRIIVDATSSEGIEGRALSVSEAATLNMEYVTVKNSNNTAVGGAGLYNNGATTLSNVVFDNNKTLKTLPGGAIYHKAGILTMTDCVISNSYGNLGAGLYAANGTKTTLTGCAFTGNNSATWGGGIDYEGQELYSDGSLAFVVNDCMFANNSAVQSGGAMCLKHATINGATFSENTAKVSGPDVYNGSNSYITILGKLDNMSIAYSGTASATKVGGTIDAQSNITIIPTSYELGRQVLVKESNSVTDDVFKAAVQTMKLENDKWLINEQGCIEQKPVIEVNGVGYHTLDEAVAAVESGGTITLLDDFTISSRVLIEKSVTIKAKKAVTITRASTLTAGMVEAQNTSGGDPINVSIIGTETAPITLNSYSGTTSITGKALWIGANTNFCMQYVTVKNGLNKQTGGAALLNAGGTITLEHVNFDNNKVSSNNAGGAIRNNSGTITITDAIFSGNEGYDGGAYYAQDGTKNILTRCTFTGNTDRNRGGAIYYNGSANKNGSPAFVMNDCTFTGNSAKNYAGAMFIKNATINGATFENNTVGSTRNDVYLSANLTISGAIKGMVVQYSASTAIIKVGGAIDEQSDITILPVSYTLNTALVAKSSTSISDDVFRVAIQRMTVAPNGTVNNWIINESGLLVQSTH